MADRCLQCGRGADAKTLCQFSRGAEWAIVLLTIQNVIPPEIYSVKAENLEGSVDYT